MLAAEVAEVVAHAGMVVEQARLVDPAEEAYISMEAGIVEEQFTDEFRSAFQGFASNPLEVVTALGVE